MIDNVIGVAAFFASFALPICAIMFWIFWYRSERNRDTGWRRVAGITAALCATSAILWQHIFPIILHRHYLLSGSEDDAWWALLISSIRAGLVLSLAGILLGVVGRGFTRIFSMASSALMVLTYFVLFSIR